MSYEYSSDFSDELIVGEHFLKKNSKLSEESGSDYEEEEETKEKEIISSVIRKESKVFKLKDKAVQNQVSKKKVQESYSSYSYSEDEIYEVEEVVNHRKKNGQLQYYLKWAGYPSSDNTWEFEDNLNCLELIKDYWNKKGNEKIKRSELKMFQKKELEIRKQKFNGKEKPVPNKRTEKKNEKQKALNQGIVKNSLVFNQIPFPLYNFANSKYRIQSITSYQIKDRKLYYNAILDNDDTVSFSSKEVQQCNPNILLDYIEKIIISNNGNA